MLSINVSTFVRVILQIYYYFATVMLPLKIVLINNVYTWKHINFLNGGDKQGLLYELENT